VGSAAGGGVAADYAVSHPDRLLSLVINSNPAGLSGGDIVKPYESLRPKGFEGMPADFRELVITEATLKRLPLPTLLITGEADLYSPPALIRMVAAQIPNSEVAIVREAGHSSYWEQPEAFNRAALDFLARHSK
jgi:pimeloyl-ACP methyl ester carboxylesterase